jgi:uncharacterized membrane protein YdjX (TVP38/TMEM64 family)
MITPRRLLTDRYRQTGSFHPKWDIVRSALAEDNAIKTLWIVFLLRLSPVLPFGTTNVLLATTGVNLWAYVTGTILGLAPRAAIVALAAASAEQLDFGAGRSWWMLGVGIVATVACIVALAWIGKRALHRATNAAST